jgi:hypothetical protein
VFYRCFWIFHFGSLKLEFNLGRSGFKAESE